MKSLSKNLLVGLVASVLVSCGARAGFAAPPPPHYHHHHHPYYHHWHYPPVIYPAPVVVRPVTVVAAATPIYTAPDTSNPAPLADIRLVNPAANRVTLRFRLNGGDLQALPAGTSIALGQVATISFDRGGSGSARYQLTDGTYRFVASNGSWDLAHDASQSSGAVADAGNPAPGT